MRLCRCSTCNCKYLEILHGWVASLQFRAPLRYRTLIEQVFLACAILAAAWMRSFPDWQQSILTSWSKRDSAAQAHQPPFAVCLLSTAALLGSAVAAILRGSHGHSKWLAASRFQPGCATILAANCFSCHGPDRRCASGAAARLEESAFRKRPGHPMRLFRDILSRAN